MARRRYKKLHQQVEDLNRILERQAQQRLLRDVPPFGDWLGQVSPSWRWDWPYLALIRRELDKITRGEIDRLMIFAPPRHGKSEQTSIRYPVWRLEKDPATRVVLGAYNQTHAEKLSRKARTLARTRIPLSRDRTAAKQWETPQAGGIRACGVGSPPTGEGADLLVIDDPIKRQEEADSETYREKVWDWYSIDLLSRLEPNAAIILINTRWNEDDLSGRIMASEQASRWSVINLPALAEAGDVLGRQPGEALCPERYSAEDLRRILADMGEQAFAALYQQRPTPESGGFFKRHWFDQRVDALPVGCKLVRYWDTAGTAGGGCYTAGVLMGKAPDGYFYVAHANRGQWDEATREKTMKEQAEEDRDSYGRVEVGVEQQPGSSGKEAAAATVRNLAGFNAFADRATGDKEERARPFAAQCGAGNVRLVRGPWNKAYVDELCLFPHGKYKDQVDGSSGAFARLNAARGVKVRA